MAYILPRLLYKSFVGRGVHNLLRVPIVDNVFVTYIVTALQILPSPFRTCTVTSSDYPGCTISKKGSAKEVNSIAPNPLYPLRVLGP